MWSTVAVVYIRSYGRSSITTMGAPVRNQLMSKLVRPFETKDRDALLQIGADTAFFGAPIERYMEDRRIFMDSFYAYYTDYEPQHAWVAYDGDQVVGFLTGCIDSKAHNRVMREKIIPASVWKWVRGYYHTGPKTWQYIRSVIGAAMRHEIPSVDENCYPAHLHINLLPASRGYGLGRKLIECYLSQLKELNIPAVHLQTTSMNVVACQLYEKVGFKLLDSRPTRMYAHLVDQPVENRCYGMALKS
jgi:GNAT superfamily N-acetyltransferase